MNILKQSVTRYIQGKLFSGLRKWLMGYKFHQPTCFSKSGCSVSSAPLFTVFRVQLVLCKLLHDYTAVHIAHAKSSVRVYCKLSWDWAGGAALVCFCVCINVCICVHIRMRYDIRWLGLLQIILRMGGVALVQVLMRRNVDSWGPLQVIRWCPVDIITNALVQISPIIHRYSWTEVCLRWSDIYI